MITATGQSAVACTRLVDDASMHRVTAALLLVGVLVVGCTAPSGNSAPGVMRTSPSKLSPTPRASVTQTPVPPTPIPILPTATPAPLRVWLDPYAPVVVREMAAAALARRSTAPASFAAGADLRIGVGLPVRLARWVYAVVVPFPTYADNVAWEDMLRFWAGETGALGELSNDARSPTLFVTSEILGVLQSVLGAPSAAAPITVTASADLVDKAWAARPHAWAIVPFDELQPRWKVLSVDGASVLDKGLDVERYPLAVSIGAQGEESDSLVTALITMADGKLITNRDTARMTVLIMTGVTAMARSIAARMEEKGILYPVEKVGKLLMSADVTHISNEIPFTEKCPTPDFDSKSLTFCSSPRYMDLLRTVGTDVIELTGNHVHDYGAQAMLDTLEMYRGEGWLYFGGGKDLEEARRPLLMEVNGNKLSFVGCNPVGPPIAWATADGPGAAPCDYEYVHATLATLKTLVDVPIATLQYWEFDMYEATPQQQVDFRGMVDAGAAIVSGSQAHQPQAIEFYKGGFIHYGLGNLFFDQMWSLPTRQEVVDRHVIYKGRHISTELHTFMLEDYSQPRPMTDKERVELLAAVFKASGW